MKIGRVILIFPAASVVAISLLVMGHRAKAASPAQAMTAAAPAKAPTASSMAAEGGAISIPDTTLAINSDKAMSERVVHYEIDAKYDASTHTVNATEVLTYHNLTGQALDHFPFHLYQNAFQPKATFVREAKLVGSRDTAYAKWEDKDYGSEDIKSLEVVGQGELTSQLQYIQPDDGNKDDKTVVDLHVPRAIAPGAYVQFKIAFQTKFPETQARSGWKRDFVLGGQWFPKVGVFWHGAWNCHQYHNTTEFFADFGVFDVKLTVPQTEVVGASGVLVSDAANSDGTKTYIYHGDDIHDFAWTASPRYKVKEDGVFNGQMGPVKLRILMQPAHWSQAERHEKILMETLDRFEKWYGPYPYKMLTLVDPEPDSAAGGMEYPTFITGDSSWFMPKGVLLPELWWSTSSDISIGTAWSRPTNLKMHGWMKASTAIREVKVLDSIFGQDRSMLQQGGRDAGRARGAEAQLCQRGRHGRDRAKGLRILRFELLRRSHVWQDCERAADSRRNHRRRHDGKGHAHVFHEVPVHASHKRRFPEDNRRSFRERLALVFQSGNLWHAGAGLRSVGRWIRYPANWYEDEKIAGKKKDDKDSVYLSTVWLHRKEDFVFPVELEVKFSNGEKVREHWDGQSRWVKFQYEKKAKVESAEIDPDHKILIDRNNFNNSLTAEENAKPRNKLSNYLLFVTQWLGQALAWWAV